MIKILIDGLKEMKKDLKNKNIKKQLANLFTFSRFFSPFILIPLYFSNHKYIFMIMVIMFALTDTFDGYFARKYNSYSLFGAYLDAVVDKIFVLTLLIPIFSNYMFILLFLELLISIINIYLFIKNMKPKTNYIGKVKTTFLFILIALLYLRKFVDFNNIIIDIVLTITIILQITTLIFYIKKITK